MKVKVIIEGKFGKTWRELLTFKFDSPAMFDLPEPKEYRHSQWVGPFKATLIGRIRFVLQ